MVFWIAIGSLLVLTLAGAWVLDRRHGGGRLSPHAVDDHTAAVATVEVNRLHQNGGWAG
ncbi:hypothetical protein V3N99_00160 [Dermatophilaceae bacterium Soc4.6]